MGCFRKNAVQAFTSTGGALSRYIVNSLPIGAESTFRVRWDTVMSAVLIYIVITVPLRIGFGITNWIDWIAPDLVTDLLLVVDILFWSVTCYELEGEEVKDLNAIRTHYLTGYFIVDILAVLPLEVFVVCLDSYYPWLRCNRLLRLLHVNYYFRTWEMVSFVKPSVIRIIKSTFVVIGLAHFIGCAFFLVILSERENAGDLFTGTENIQTKPLYSQYLRAIYWSFVTMTGYNNTNPQTYVETIFSIIVTLLGISVVATTIGSVGSLVTNLDSSALYFRQKIDTINDYMKYKQIPTDLQDEVRNYFTYLWKTGKGLEQTKVLEDLPQYLKNKLNVALNSENIKKVPLFEKCKDDAAFIAEVVKCLKPHVCLPNSLVVRKGEVGTQMFFIHRGELNVVSDDDRVVLTLKDGGFFGEIALLYDTKRTATIVARTYCDLFVLTKEDLKKVMKKFPTQSEVIREVARERFQNIVENNKRREASSEYGSEVEDDGLDDDEDDDPDLEPEKAPSITTDSVLRPSPSKASVAASALASARQRRCSLDVMGRSYAGSSNRNASASFSPSGPSPVASVSGNTNLSVPIPANGSTEMTYHI